MRILYVGRDHGTSGHRKAALLRLGHEVSLFDAYACLPPNRLVGQWRRHTGGLGLVELVRRGLLGSLRRQDFDLAWIDHGDLIGPALVDELKARIPRVLCYTIDDPFGGRDRMLWRTFFRALPRYDLLVVVRAVNVDEAYGKGAKKVLRVFMSADEVAHAPRKVTAADREEWKSEVVFVGTAFPERGPLLAELVRLGVPLTIYGNRYHRLREWPVLQPYWRERNADTVEGYANAIQSAKVCLGLLSRGNRDLHTTRSMEIPSLGGLLCAERTSEHLNLYEEDHEAVLWSDPKECAAKCFALLADDSRRQAIAIAGHQRYLSNPWRNMEVAQTILNAVTGQPSAGAQIDGGRLTEGVAPQDKIETAREVRSGPLHVPSSDKL